MTQHVTVVGGGKGSIRGGGRGDPNSFRSHMQARAAVHKTNIRTQLKKEAERIVQQLSEENPARTGASAGRPDRAVAPMTASHPAFGMTIGNRPFNSGWQVRFSNTSDTGSITARIVSPLWDAYVHFLEYVNPTSKGFVQRVWKRHIARR